MIHCDNLMGGFRGLTGGRERVFALFISLNEVACAFSDLAAKFLDGLFIAVRHDKLSILETDRDHVARKGACFFAARKPGANYDTQIIRL
jgi:hypothetical protein